MSRPLIAAALIFAAFGVGTPARACAVHESLNLGHARNADVVVIGRISAGRSRGANASGLFVDVDEVLAGRAARRLPIAIRPGLAIPPAMMRGQVLVALRRSSPAGLTIIQHICSDPFILDARSREAGFVRGMLTRRR